MALTILQRIKQAGRHWLLHRLPACQEMTPVISASLDRPLGWRESITMKLHLRVCVWCIWYLNQLRFMRNALRTDRAAQDNSHAPALTDEARERIKRNLQASNR